MYQETDSRSHANLKLSTHKKSTKIKKKKAFPPFLFLLLMQDTSFRAHSLFFLSV